MNHSVHNRLGKGGDRMKPRPIVDLKKATTLAKLLMKPRGNS